MAGTRKGGISAAKKNKKLHGDDFYARIGAKGGRKRGVKKGFAANPKLASIAGADGGAKSKRGKKKDFDLAA